MKGYVFLVGKRFIEKKQVENNLRDMLSYREYVERIKHEKPSIIALGFLQATDHDFIMVDLDSLETKNVSREHVKQYMDSVLL